VAYEAAAGIVNPTLTMEPLAFTCGPEGGITDEEFLALRDSGWLPVCLGRSILRAVTAPVAMMGAIQFQLNR
jgi:16S rRNA (uracil1498-N3)-methyltransferase